MMKTSLMKKLKKWEKELSQLDSKTKDCQEAL
jgi:hypothetical protein